MAVYVAVANPDKVVEGIQAVDHTLQFPFIDQNFGAEVTITAGTNSGTIKINARGLASESDLDLASGDSISIHVYKELSFRKTVTADTFTYQVNTFMS